MCILNVINRIFLTLLLGQFQIKINLTVRTAHDKEKAGRIASNVFEQFIQGNSRTGTFGHTYNLPSPIQSDQLHKHHVEMIRIIPNGLHSPFHASNMAMMICAPDINDPVKTPVEFILVIGNISCKICGQAVGPEQDFIFFIPEKGRPEPECPILFVNIIAFPQIIYHFFNFALIMQRFFTEPDIIVNTEIVQGFFDIAYLFLQGIFNHSLPTLSRTYGKILIFIFPNNTLDRIDNILTGIAVFRELHILPHQLQISGFQRLSEYLNLVAAVINIEFPFYIVASPGQYIGQRIPQCSAAGIAHVQIASGVGAYEFHLYFFIDPRAFPEVISHPDNHFRYFIKPAVI